jgi:hypothetical protein
MQLYDYPLANFHVICGTTAQIELSLSRTHVIGHTHTPGRTPLSR